MHRFLHIDRRLVQTLLIMTAFDTRPNLRTDNVLVGHGIPHCRCHGFDPELMESQSIATTER
jgi:hypothetical protein